MVRDFGESLSKIEEEGEADLQLAGRLLTIKRQFVEDLCKTSVKDHTASLKKALMILHSPMEQKVGIEKAAEVYEAAKHPKSFVSLDDADHLLSREKDAAYAASVITAWSERFVENDPSSEGQ